jgi:hypothetical protein
VSFVPLQGAGPRGNDVVVAHGKARVISAPSADPDGTLSLDEETTLYAHYGLGYSTRRSESGLPEEPPSSDAEIVEVEVEVTEVEVQPARPRLRRRRVDEDFAEDFDMVRLSSKDVPIVVKQQKGTGPR